MAKTKHTSRFRLPGDARPIDYDLHVEPDLEAGTFQGQVSIAIRLDRPARSIVLHAAGLVFDEVWVRIWGDRYDGKAKLDALDETAELSFSRDLPSGRLVVVLRYHADLGSQLRGFYKSSSGKLRFAFTQLEAADARRLLPCFDEPCFKARFRVAVTTTKGNAVVSNSAIEREEELPKGKRTVHFAETPPLSTYLLAIAVGPLEASKPVMCGTTPIRLWHVPGKGELVDFALEAAAESLKRLEDYFGIPYPYGKLDLVACPDFEAGAMENAGAVFFRETLLLLDPETVSLPERKRAAEVIAHELAHMWYGDLVTMAWWDDLWLNEAFATWMAYVVVDDWKPEWRMWHSFEHDRAAALGLDALANTHSIYAPVRSVAEATENFDVITYEKGAAVVRMIEHYLGAETFRDGVRIYIRRHREGNAVAQDLWHALEEAAEREVSRVARAWIGQEGFPLVQVSGGPRGTLAVKQERFFADATVSPARRKSVWPVPLVVKSGGAGEPTTDRLIVDTASTTVKTSARSATWVFGNAGAGGFYRVQHDAKLHQGLVAELRSALTPVERQAFVGDQWALVRAGRGKVESFLDVADALADETDHDVLDTATGPLAILDDQVLEPGGKGQAAYHSWIASRFRPAFDALGWKSAKGESDATRLRRASLLRIVGRLAEDPEVVAQARERLDAYLADRSTLDANLADSVVGLAARVGDVALYERYVKVSAEGRTPQERRRFLMARAGFRAPAVGERLFASILAAEIPVQDLGFVVMGLFSNTALRARAWIFLTKHWKKLRPQIPPLMVSRLVDATPALRDPRYAREVARFFEANPVAEAARSLKQAAEVFKLNAELRKRTQPGLERWLSKRA